MGQDQNNAMDFDEYNRRNGKNNQTIIRLLKRDKFGTSSG